MWIELDPVRGREQSGRRPALVVASDLYLEQANTLMVIVPVTGWIASSAFGSPTRPTSAIRRNSRRTQRSVPGSPFWACFSRDTQCSTASTSGSAS